VPFRSSNPALPTMQLAHGVHESFPILSPPRSPCHRKNSPTPVDKWKSECGSDESYRTNGATTPERIVVATPAPRRSILLRSATTIHDTLPTTPLKQTTSRRHHPHRGAPDSDPAPQDRGHRRHLCRHPSGSPSETDASARAPRHRRDHRERNPIRETSAASEDGRRR
jgi:hypothetical protein